MRKKEKKGAVLLSKNNKNNLRPTVYDLVPLERRLNPLTEDEIKLLTKNQTREANAIINDNKYKAFAREYVKTGNARASALAVGFSSSNGYKLLSNKKVQKYLNELTDLAGTEEIANIQESLMYLSAIVRGEVVDYAYTKDGEVFEMPAQVKDRVKALDIITKCQGLQQNNLKVSGKIENINVSVDTEVSDVVYEVDPSEVEVIDVEDFLD